MLWKYLKKILKRMTPTTLVKVFRILIQKQIIFTRQLHSMYLNLSDGYIK